MAPATPLRLQVLDRFYDALDAIEAGDDYFFKPHMVVKHPELPYEKAKYGPLYSVLTESGPNEGLNDESDMHYTETFHVAVRGIVHDLKDIGSTIEKSIRDVRYAIDSDARSSTAGTLGVLCDLVSIDDPPDLDYLEYFGFFEQLFRVQISGDYRTL